MIYMALSEIELFIELRSRNFTKGFLNNPMGNIKPQLTYIQSQLHPGPMSLNPITIGQSPIKIFVISNLL